MDTGYGQQEGILDRKECGLLLIRSHFPPQAAGNALAFAVQLSLCRRKRPRIPKPALTIRTIRVTRNSRE